MKNLSQKSTKLLAIASPIMATNLELNPGIKSTFQPLTDITANSIISGAISLVLVVVIIVFFFILILGGFKWITSSGDEKKLTVARAQISGAFVGLTIVFASWAILNLIQTIFGINILSDGLSIPSFNPNTSTSTPIDTSKVNTNPAPGYIDTRTYDPNYNPSPSPSNLGDYIQNNNI